MRRTVVLVLALALLLAAPAAACTTFCYLDGTRVLFGRNYDFEHGTGVVLVNPRGLAKTSASRGNPASWQARFGSVTFNQFGQDQPMGGVNEKGLVVELMWLDEARYPPPDARPTVSVLEWIQYALDRFETVAEFLHGIETVRIAGRTPLHFLVADRTGDAAAIEFLDGKLVTHRGPSLRARALANSTYADSLAYLERRVRQGDTAPAFTRRSLDRFARAAELVAVATAQPAGSEEDAVGRAFAALEAVKQPHYTRWQIVYDLTAMRIHWRTEDNVTRRHLDVGALDFTCGAVRGLGIDAGHDAVGSAFAPHTVADNLALVRTSFSKTSFLSAVSAADVERLGRWPDSTRCP
jgi:penicillin V acylase-like amidase (Ntn superfamily)